MKHHALLVAFASSLLAPLVCSQGIGAPKQVAAPPQDLTSGHLRLPDPADHPQRSRFQLVHWPADSEGEPRSVTLPEGSLRLGVLAQGSVELRLDGVPAVPVQVEPAPEGWRASWTQGYELPYVAAGRSELSLDGRGEHEAWVVVRDALELEGRTWVATWQRTSDRDLPLHAMIAGEAHELQRVWFASEDGRRIALQDDGRGHDHLAGDGVFSGTWPRGSQGRVAGFVHMEGVAAAGPFARSVPLHFQVEAPALRLLSTAQTRVLDAQRLRIDLPASRAASGRRLLAAAELWGHDVHGRPAPACWLARMQDPEVRQSVTSLRLDLDARWLNQAALRAPLELRNLRVQDADSQVVLDSRAHLDLPVHVLPPVVGQPAGEIDQAMLMGSFVSAGNLFGVDDLQPNPALLVVHGYCSDGMPWPGGAFSQPKRTFVDADANRSHDEFAQEMIAQAAGLTSFGVIGHSQGGNAALHLYTFYQSPLDLAQGPRRIQSVATPYQGTPLASLGFFACGVNDDLTPAGASAWLATIPTWARAEVTYWTVSDGGSACNFFTGLLLGNPEDGTVEVSRGQLPGGNNMGNQTGWCHTSGMSFPSCTTDGQRNAEIDAQAAR